MTFSFSVSTLFLEYSEVKISNRLSSYKLLINLELISVTNSTMYPCSSIYLLFSLIAISTCVIYSTYCRGLLEL